MKRGTTDHPKTKTLAKLLNVPTPMAVGVLQLLWEFAADYALDGGVGKFTDEHIAEACGWGGPSGLLVAALSDERCRWLDESEFFRLIVHDWPDHCEDSVHNKLARARRYFANGAVPKLSRLSKGEKSEADRFYAENPVPTFRPAVSGACDKRTEQAHTIRTPHAETYVCGEQKYTYDPSVLTMPVHAMPLPSHAMPEKTFALKAAASSISGRWPEFRVRWAEITGSTVNLQQAAMAWNSIVTPDIEHLVFECLESYALSQQVLDGVLFNPDNWLWEQHRNKWDSRWPQAREPTKKLSNAERMVADAERLMGNGF